MVSKYQVTDNIIKSKRCVLNLTQKRKDFMGVLSGFLVFLIIFLLALVPSSSATAAQCPQDISLGYYTIQGSPSFESGGLIKISHNENVSLTLKTEKLLEGNLDIKQNTFIFKVMPNTKVTLSYKTLSHDFIMSEDQKPFYIETNDLKVIPILPKTDNVSKLQDTSNCENYCYKSVYAWDCNCCKGGYVGECYGWVTCGAGWKEKDCMKDVNEEIYCANNC